MRVCANLPPAGARLDLFRGLANWAICLDHIPHEILNSLTTRNYGFSDAADLFVFISGYTAAFVFGRIMIAPTRGYVAAASRLARRAFTLYAAHSIVVVIYIAVIAWVSRELNDPDDLNQFNVAVFINTPFREFLRALALRYRPYADIDLLDGRVFCRKAFWLESGYLAIGVLVFQSVRLAVAVFPGRLDRLAALKPFNRSFEQGLCSGWRPPTLSLPSW
jgi:peptidoglycan/LPS O-acetylase OafA/YrhL